MNPQTCPGLEPGPFQTPAFGTIPVLQRTARALRRARDKKLGVIGVLATCLCMLAPATAPAQSAVEEFYKGRQINLIVGYGPGGGYDITARLLARHLGDYIPGHPAIVVQNMAGAGSMRAANYLYVSVPKDGTTFGAIGRDMPLIGLIGSNSSVQFHPRQFTSR